MKILCYFNFHMMLLCCLYVGQNTTLSGNNISQRLSGAPRFSRRTIKVWKPLSQEEHPKLPHRLVRQEVVLVLRTLGCHFATVGCGHCCFWE